MLGCNFSDLAKSRCSASAFGNWLLPIRLLEATPVAITLEVPNVFVKEYLLTHYKAELCSFLPVDAKGEPLIQFVLAAAAPKKALAPSEPKPEKDLERSNAAFQVKLNHNYRFATFIEGPNNQFVKSAAYGCRDPSRPIL